MGLQMEEFEKKKIDFIKISEHMQHFNESYVEQYLLTLLTIFDPIRLTILPGGYFLTESSVEIEGAFLWGYLDQDQ